MKKEKKEVQVQSKFAASWKKANAVAALLLALAVCVVLPIIFQDYYFNILTVKYWFYCGSVIAAAAAVLGIAAVYSLKDSRKSSRKDRQKHWREMLSDFSLKNMSAPDWAMLLFFAAALISTLQSEYLYESFWGNEGRFTGLFLIILYTVSFFIITRYLDFRKWILDAFLGAGLIVCLVGILHYFNIDPIGFKAELRSEDFKIFTSTIGNINTYTSYVALIVGASALLFSVEENGKKKAFYGISMAVSIFALITGISDNAYLAFMALLALMPLYLFNSVKGLRHYVIILAVTASEFVLIDFISRTMPKQVMEINGLFNVIADLDMLPVITLLLWAAAAGIFAAERFVLAGKGAKESNIGRWLWLAVLAVVFVVGLYILFDANVKGNGDRYGALKGYVVFNDDWGTHRGYIWRIGMELYERFPLIHKIFGYGPDTFGILTVNSYYEEMIMKYSEKFDSAHNEYLQYFITVGAAGLAAYLGLLITSVVQVIRNAKEDPALMAIPMAVACYGAQAFVNISVPIVAPIMLTLLMIGLAAGMNKKEK